MKKGLDKDTSLRDRHIVGDTLERESSVTDVIMTCGTRLPVGYIF